MLRGLGLNEVLIILRIEYVHDLRNKGQRITTLVSFEYVGKLNVSRRCETLCSFLFAHKDESHESANSTQP